MMDLKTIILFEQAKNDSQFQSELKEAGEDVWNPSLIKDAQTKITFTAVYYGWLIGKQIYDPSKYE